MSLTAIVVASIIILIAIVDVILYVRSPKQTISAWMIKHSKKHPIFVLLIGIICGHLFWRMNTLDVYQCHEAEIQEIINTCKVK